MKYITWFLSLGFVTWFCLLIVTWLCRWLVCRKHVRFFHDFWFMFHCCRKVTHYFHGLFQTEFSHLFTIWLSVIEICVCCKGYGSGGGTLISSAGEPEWWSRIDSNPRNGHSGINWRSSYPLTTEKTLSTDIWQ